MYQLICANCQGEGKAACKNCLLVLYCGGECQKSHWNDHKKDCKSTLGKESWTPRWVLENRKPLFMGGAPISTFGGKKYLWGNMPAIDILKLDPHEGLEYTDDLRLLVAASGDLRNVVKTLTSVPGHFPNKFAVVINDRDFDIVSRNALLLLVAFVAENEAKAVDCMIHLWYSAMLSEDHMELLSGPVRKLVEDVCSKITCKSPGAVLGKTWKFAASSLRLVLTKEQWPALLACLNVPETVTFNDAQSIRTRITLAHERRDYLDRALFSRPPKHRICATRFREDGMLLPFGKSRAGFHQPNPTFFQSGDWPMKDSADPLDGWAYSDMSGSGYGLATNDLYGRLHNYLSKIFADLHHRLNSFSVEVQLFNIDAEKLKDQLEDGTFARVEVSNISDNWCLGTARTVAQLGPFLQPLVINPHATLLTLYMNAVDEEKTKADEMRSFASELERVLQYLPQPKSLLSPYDPQVLMNDAARELVQDNDKYFDRYTKRNKFEEIEQFCDMSVKERNTIVDKWPMRLKKQSTEVGAKDEFKLLMGSAHTAIQMRWIWIHRKEWQNSCHVQHAYDDDTELGEKIQVPLITQA